MGDLAFIGIDGGGTGCRLALRRGDETFFTDGGPCNVSTDLAGALRELSAGLDRLAAQAGIDRGAVRNLPSCLGLAGVVVGDPRDDIASSLRLSNAQIVDDRAIALRGALGNRDGAMVGLGTGSFFAIQRDDHIRLAGGWGLQLGDEASGGWLGREALHTALQTLDGLLPATDLTDALLAKFGSATGIVAFSLKAQPQDYAALAPTIIEAADAGDTTARDLIRRGRTYILETLEAIGWETPMPLCLTGGLAQSYARYLPSPVQGCLISPQSTALEGALLMAAGLAE